MMRQSRIVRRSLSSSTNICRLGVRVPQRAQPSYKETLRTALQCNVRTFDVDTEDDAPLAQALQDILKEDAIEEPIQILYRLGYKSLNSDDNNKTERRLLPDHQL